MITTGHWEFQERQYLPQSLPQLQFYFSLSWVWWRLIWLDLCSDFHKGALISAGRAPVDVTEAVAHFAFGTNFVEWLRVDWELVQHIMVCLTSLACFGLVFTFIQSADSPFFRLRILHSIFYPSLISHCLPFITVVPSTLSSHFLDSSLTVCTSPSAVSLRMVQQRQHSVASGWPRACREGWRCFLSLWSHASWQNRACKVCAASESHPSSFFVHLHLNSAGLWMPKQLTSQRSSERGCYLLEKQRPLICATVAFSFVLVGEGLMRAIIRAI